MAPSARLITALAFALCLFLAHVNALTKSSGCGKALPGGVRTGGESNKVTITSNGVKRTYLMHVPSNYNKDNARGLIFSFHGRTANGAQQERLSQFSNAKFNPNMFAIYPDGIDNMWQGDPKAKSNDIRFTLDMIDHISSRYCINTDKIFAAGKSNGGGFAARVLACDPTASRKIAAFASAAGAYYSGDAADCKPDTEIIYCSPGRKPIPIFETHGTADDVIHYEGGQRRGGCLPTIPHFMKAWSVRNGFTNANVSTSLFGGNVHKYEYGKSAGKQGIGVHYKINGLGHAWPSTTPNDDTHGTYFDATPLMMDFFNKYTL